jgi:hypothetical protein
MAKYSYHRLDANHRAIVEGLRERGVSVELKGPLDVLCGFRGRNYLLEVKTARGKVRRSQEGFLQSWKGQAAIVRNLEEALREIGCEVK